MSSHGSPTSRAKQCRHQHGVRAVEGEGARLILSSHMNNRSQVSNATTVVLLTLHAGQFLMTLDTAVMNVSIATVAKDVGTDVTGIQTAITLYTLVMASLMITGGKIGELIGRRAHLHDRLRDLWRRDRSPPRSPRTSPSSSSGGRVPGGNRRGADHAGDRRARRLELPRRRPPAGLRAGRLSGCHRRCRRGLSSAGSSRHTSRGGSCSPAKCSSCSASWPSPARWLIRLPQESTPASTSWAPPYQASGMALIVFGVLRAGIWGVVQPKPDAPQWLGLSPVIWLLLGGGVVIWLFLIWEQRLIDRRGAPLVDPALTADPPDFRSGLTAFFFQYLVQAGLFYAVPLYLSVALGLEHDRHRAAPAPAVDHAPAQGRRGPEGVPERLATSRQSNSASSRSSSPWSC